MSNIIDMNARLQVRQFDADFKQLAIRRREIIEDYMAGSPWPHLFAGLTKMPGMDEWTDQQWATLRLDVSQLPKPEEESMFGASYTFATDFRSQIVPEFGNQAITEFLNVVCWVKKGVVKGVGMTPDQKQELKEKLLNYVNSFSQVSTTKFCFQMGFLANLLDNNIVHFHDVKHTDAGKLEIKVSIPADDSSMGLRMAVTATFDFLPLVLDSLAVAYVQQLTQE